MNNSGAFFGAKIKALCLIADPDLYRYCRLNFGALIIERNIEKHCTCQALFLYRIQLVQNIIVFIDFFYRCIEKVLILISAVFDFTDSHDAANRNHGFFCIGNHNIIIVVFKYEASGILFNHNSAINREAFRINCSALPGLCRALFLEVNRRQRFRSIHQLNPDLYSRAGLNFFFTGHQLNVKETGIADIRNAIRSTLIFLSICTSCLSYICFVLGCAFEDLSDCQFDILRQVRVITINDRDLIGVSIRSGQALGNDNKTENGERICIEADLVIAFCRDHFLCAGFFIKVNDRCAFCIGKRNRNLHFCLGGNLVALGIPNLNVKETAECHLSIFTVQSQGGFAVLSIDFFVHDLFSIHNCIFGNFRFCRAGYSNSVRISVGSQNKVFQNNHGIHSKAIGIEAYTAVSVLFHRKIFCSVFGEMSSLQALAFFNCLSNLIIAHGDGDRAVPVLLRDIHIIVRHFDVGRHQCAFDLCLVRIGCRIGRHYACKCDTGHELSFHFFKIPYRIKTNRINMIGFERYRIPPDRCILHVLLRVGDLHITAFRKSGCNLVTGNSHRDRVFCIRLESCAVFFLNSNII